MVKKREKSKKFGRCAIYFIVFYANSICFFAFPGKLLRKYEQTKMISQKYQTRSHLLFEQKGWKKFLNRQQNPEKCSRTKKIKAFYCKTNNFLEFKNNYTILRIVFKFFLNIRMLMKKIRFKICFTFFHFQHFLRITHH